MTLRRVLFWSHLITALFAGIVVLIMSISGVLLTFQRQITEWADRAYRVPATSASRLSPATLLARFHEAHPDLAPATLTIRSDPQAPAVVSITGGRIVYIDPYTGTRLGESSPRMRAFFRTVTDWHRWLAVSTEQRATGRAITGASNLGFLFIVLSGIYLWWPRRWTWAAVTPVLWFRRGLRGKARDFNWHNTIGLWTSLPLVVVVATAVLISYQWANTLMFRLVGDEPPARVEAPAAPAQGRGERRVDGAARASGFAALDHGWRLAEQQVKGWRSISLRLPTSADAPLTFAIDRGNGARPDLRAQLILDGASGEVIRFEPYASQSLGRRLRTWARWLHTGEALGIGGQAAAGLASAGACVLVWTGFALTWRRFRAWVARRSSSLVRRVVGPPSDLHPSAAAPRPADLMNDARFPIPIEAQKAEHLSG